MIMNKYVNGVLVALTNEEIEQITIHQTELLEEQKANAWLDGRLAEYPSITDQLDNIYHSGIDSWKADIAVIKTKHPKPID